MISRQIVPGQMDLFTIIEEFLTLMAKRNAALAKKRRTKKAVAASDTAEEAKELKPEDYLKKGEYLLSLAKDRFKKELEELTLSDYEKKLYSIEITKSASLHTIVEQMAKVLRTMLRGETEYDEEGEFMKFLRSQIKTPFSLEPLKRETTVTYFEPSGDGVTEHVWDTPPVRELRSKWHHSDDILLLTIWEDNAHPMPVIGYRAFSHPKNRRDLLYRSWHLCVHCTDIAVCLAWLIMISQYNKIMADESKRPMVLSAFEGARDFVRRYFRGSFTGEAILETTYGGRRGRDLSERLSALDMKSLLTSESGAPIRIPDRWNHRPSATFLEYVTKECGIDIDDVKVMSEVPTQKPRQELEDAWREVNFKTASTTATCKPLCYIIDNKTELAFMASNPIKAGEIGLELKLSNLQAESDRQYVADPMERKKHWILPGYNSMNSVLFDVVEVVARTLFRERKAAIEAYNYYSSLGSKDHAKSYETKKGIPAATIKEMQESLFNKFFGYVELDELCDIQKVRTIADEFSAMMEMYFNSLDLKEVSLRFRRLGNHKASGLYYPQVNCLCVDVGSPDSFTHELGHCIDHVTGEGRARSEEGNFYSIWARYCDLLDNYLWKGDAEKVKVLRGNTKYNLSYYKIKTEVFARTFEMYCTRVLGIQNSICNPDKANDFAYPVDELLDRLVKEYFDKLVKEVLNNGSLVSDEPEDEELEAA